MDNKLCLDPQGNPLRVWDLESGRLLRWLEGFNRNISTLVTIPDGRQLIFGADAKSIMVWDLETRQILGTLEGTTMTSDP